MNGRWTAKFLNDVYSLKNIWLNSINFYPEDNTIKIRANINGYEISFEYRQEKDSEKDFGLVSGFMKNGDLYIASYYGEDGTLNHAVNEVMTETTKW